MPDSRPGAFAHVTVDGCHWLAPAPPTAYRCATSGCVSEAVLVRLCALAHTLTNAASGATDPDLSAGRAKRNSDAYRVSTDVLVEERAYSG